MYDILIVEDEAPIANLIRMSLTQAGYRCTIASDGDEGADWVERRRFDLILLDVMLPHTSGFELMEYIRQYDTPVIFLTARTEVRDRVKGLRLGAEDYIIKPFDVAELQARVVVGLLTLLVLRCVRLRAKPETAVLLGMTLYAACEGAAASPSYNLVLLLVVGCLCGVPDGQFALLSRPAADAAGASDG